jgi:tetratricopeptide (TPR) repeat protein
MWQSRFMLMVVTALVCAGSQTFGQVDEPPNTGVPTKVGERIIIQQGAELRPTKQIDKDVENLKRFQQLNGGELRLTFRVYQVLKIEKPWAWVQSESDGATGWVQLTEATTLEAAFERATAEILANPQNTSLLVSRALLWAEKGEIDLAIADYDQVIKIDPRSPIAHNNRGNLYRLKKDTDKAITDFTEAINLDPDYAGAYNNRGITWKFKDIDKAIADFTESLKIDPKSALTYNNRGNAYREKQEVDKAIADFTEAIKLQPRYTHAIVNRGMARRSKNLFKEAVEDYNEALKIDPKNGSSYNNLAWLWATCPDAKYRDAAKAVEFATKACELTAFKSGNYLDTLAAACAESGDFESAVRWQEKAQPLFPEGPGRARGQARLNLYKLEKPFREIEVPLTTRP